MAEVTELTPNSPPPTEKNRGGRPKKGTYRPPEARQPQFFDRVASVPKEDWGTRAFMYVYADEPVCKAKTFGTTRYLLKSSSPILDLEGLKEDYGSFKGWMSLNLRNTGKDQTDEVDRLDFEIYDPKCPPKIPRAAWANDDRNARWIALLPPEAPAPSAAASNLMEGAKFYKDIRAELKEEMEPAETVPVDQTRSTLETMKLAKELFAQPTPPAPVVQPPAKDPLEIALNLITMMNATKVENPAIALYQAELAAARDEMKELRKATAQAAPAAPPKTLMEQLAEFSALTDNPLVKKLMGGNGAAVGEVAGRAGRTTFLDFAREAMQGPAGEYIGRGIGSFFAAVPSFFTPARPMPMQSNPAQPQQPIVLNQQQPDGTMPQPEPTESRVRRIGETVSGPMLYEYFLKGAEGAAWAETMFDLWPEDYAFMRRLGADYIINAYRQVPQAWALIAPKETAFITFMQEFCKWDPNEDEGPVDPGGPDDGVREFTEEEGN